MKVRVPKELRPPERFKPFRVRREWAICYPGWWRVKGVFRAPKRLEYYWSPGCQTVYLAKSDDHTGGDPRVILERVK